MKMREGPELDRELDIRVLGGSGGDRIPPFSTRDWSSLALAELIAERTGWEYRLMLSGGSWTASWFDRAPSNRRPLPTLITARGPTRALAICRALLRASRSPRWPLANVGPPPPGFRSGAFAARPVE
jgi:hypothetical protein